MSFIDLLSQKSETSNSLLCIGLDPVIEKIPDVIRNKYKNPSEQIFQFNKSIIDATHDFVCAYKPNTAFYEAEGVEGISALKQTCDYLKKMYPEIPVILDAKRGDIGNTNNGYLRFAYDYLNVDAITLDPFVGHNALLPFLKLKEKGSIILCLTSDSGKNDVQRMIVSSGFLSDPELHSTITGDPLYLAIAKVVADDWNQNNNCLLVIGATHPKEIAEVRKIVGDMTLLVPGVGAQGGDVKMFVESGVNSQKSGLIISSSRGILYAGDGENFAEKARESAINLKDEINQYR